MAKRLMPTLTRLESEIMCAVWDAQPSTVKVRDVAEAVNAGRKETLAYTTVQTVLGILLEKGFVELAGSEGRAHCYKPVVSRVDATRRVVGDLVDRLFDGRPSPLLRMLVDDPQLDNAQLRELRQWVDTRLKDSKEGKQ